MPLLLARQPAGGRRPVAARRPRGWPLAGAGALLLALVVVARTVDVAAHLEATRTRVEPLGALAPGAFVVVYVVATLLGVPGMPFTLLSPFLFGPWPAVAVMIVASGGSAAAAFLIARYLARDAFVARLAGTPGFARLSALLEAHDWVVIPVLRILPLAPFAVVNYGFGLTTITFGRYLAWSLAGMIPMNVVLVLGADLFYTAATRGRVPWPLVAGAIAAALLLAGLAAAGRRAFARS
ncbi:MAG TPA: VTT domain-containing protein [Methylomirabilota bacterium]|nr:VTT domain-containing protein [Methylomirabilota bacterium]